jgi:hypothetical protein
MYSQHRMDGNLSQHMYSQHRMDVNLSQQIIVTINRYQAFPLTRLTPRHFCACPNTGRRFPTSYVLVFLCFSCLMGEEVVRLADIDGIVDNYCLNFLFKVLNNGYERS